MNRTILITVMVVAAAALVLVDPAFASPGGKIAKAAYETFWGRVALAVLTIIFLPLITYYAVNHALAERRARKDLRFMARYSAKFDWLKIRERVKDCFLRVHAGWENEDLSTATQWMTDWYWQNQQRVYLDRWKREGLKNICAVKKVMHLRPLLFVHRNHGANHEDSIVVIAITAKMKDYLQDINSGKVVEGSKRYKDVETIWTFTLVDGEWKVSDIEEDYTSVEYAKLARQLPAIESTLMPEIQP